MLLFIIPFPPFEVSSFEESSTNAAEYSRTNANIVNSEISMRISDIL